MDIKVRITVAIFLSIVINLIGCSRELTSINDEQPRQPFNVGQIPEVAGNLYQTPAEPEDAVGSTVEQEIIEDIVGTETVEDPQEAEPVIEVEEEEDPYITNSMNGGRQALLARNYAQAAEYFLGVLERDGNHTGALYNLSLTFRHAGNPERAIEFAVKAIESDPDRLYVHQNLGYAYESNGDTNSAIEAFEEELIRHPDEPTLAVIAAKLASIYYDRELIEDAINVAITAVTLDPEVTTFHVLLGDIQFENSAYEQAIAAYEDAAELSPDVAEIVVKIGDALWELGRAGEALEKYNEAIDLDNSIRDLIPVERLEGEATEPEIPVAEQPM